MVKYLGKVGFPTPFQPRRKRSRKGEKPLSTVTGQCVELVGAVLNGVAVLNHHLERVCLIEQQSVFDHAPVILKE